MLFAMFLAGVAVGAIVVVVVSRLSNTDTASLVWTTLHGREDRKARSASNGK